MALERLRAALNAIGPSYCNVMMPGNRFRQMERVFSYELYHQMRLAFYDVDLAVHGEFEKQLNLIPELRRRNKLIPDMVVHQPHNLESNLLALEIKASRTVDRQAFQRDIRKIYFYSEISARYMRSLRFRYVVFLVINYDVSRNEDVRNYWVEAENAARSPVSIWNLRLDDAGGRVLRFFLPNNEDLHDRWGAWRAHGEL